MNWGASSIASKFLWALSGLWGAESRSKAVPKDEEEIMLCGLWGGVGK